MANDVVVGFIGLGTMGGTHGGQPSEGRLQGSSSTTCTGRRRAIISQAGADLGGHAARAGRDSPT